jgi:hypothetical protein
MAKKHVSCRGGGQTSKPVAIPKRKAAKKTKKPSGIALTLKSTRM